MCNVRTLFRDLLSKLSLGQASDLTGYSKREFMDLLANYGVSVFNYDENELDKDVENAKMHNREF